MNGIAKKNNNVIMNGKGIKNGEVYNDKKEQKRNKYRRRNSDSSKEKSPNHMAKRHSDVFDVQLRNRATHTSSPRYISENGEFHPELFTPAVDHKMQMIIIGDRNVGKTCFLERYTDNKFIEDSKSTIGIDFRMKTVTVAGKKIRLQIWDTAGQERFNSITTAYYRNAKGILLLYDVTRPETYRNLSKWLELINEYAQSDAEIVIVGNKADLPDIQVDSAKARQFAENKRCLFYETSVKERLNVDTVFVNLIYKILKQIPEPHERNPRVRRKTVVDIDEKNSQSDKGSCCRN